MTVRCPACKTLHDDPGTRFRCHGCRRTLDWSRYAAVAVQLSFMDEQGELDSRLLHSSTPDDGVTSKYEQEEPPGPIPFRCTREGRLLADSITLVAAHLMPSSGAEDGLVPALLVEQTPENVLSLLATTSWLASALVRQLDEALPGTGTAWLQGVALGLASSGDGA